MNTKRIKRNPFGKAHISLVPVAQSNGRSIWFSKEPITPDTDPINLQEAQRKQAKIQSLLFVAGANLAEKKGISSDDAREMFFPKVVDGVNVEARFNFIDFLSPSQLEDFLVLQADAADLPIIAATTFLRERLAFEVKLVTTGVIEEPWFELSAGDRLKFGDSVVTVASTVGTSIVFSEADAAGLTGNSIGFLVDRAGQYILGDKTWDESQTRSLLSIPQIQSIYQFYDDCAKDRIEEPEAVGNDSTSLSNMPIPQASIGGETSTQSVAPSESQVKTAALDMSTLVAAQ